MSRINGDERFRRRANGLVRRALELFFDDNCPLPKATHVHDHYEAVAEADTLMLALLEVCAATQTPSVDRGFLYPNR